MATIYGKFPNIVFAKASSGIKTAADLKGKKIGTPGRYGSGWVMLQALLASAKLTTDDVQIVEYPDFTQEAAVEQGAVDAATGFANNEPVQLELHGSDPVILRIDDITPLPGPGLIASTATLDAKHDAISAFVAATLQAMEEIKADPTVGLDAAIAAVPELATAKDAQAAILEATIDSWSGPTQQARSLGAIDRDGWTASIAYLARSGWSRTRSRPTSSCARTCCRPATDGPAGAGIGRIWYDEWPPRSLDGPPSSPFPCRSPCEQSPACQARHGRAVQARHRRVQAPGADDHLHLRLARQLGDAGSRRFRVDGPPVRGPRQEALRPRRQRPIRSTRIHPIRVVSCPGPC